MVHISCTHSGVHGGWVGRENPCYTHHESNSLGVVFSLPVCCCCCLLVCFCLLVYLFCFVHCMWPNFSRRYFVQLFEYWSASEMILLSRVAGSVSMVSFWKWPTSVPWVHGHHVRRPRLDLCASWMSDGKGASMTPVGGSAKQNCWTVQQAKAAYTNTTLTLNK